MSTATFDNSDIAGFLEKFKDHLSCWKVSRVIGSLIYIEMGRHWSYRSKLRRHEEIDIGSTSLSLNGDDWIIRHDKQHVADSDSVCEDDVPRISKLLCEQKLKSLKFFRRYKCRIAFTDKIEIIVTAGPDDDDLCVLFLPDGTNVGCDAIDGFQSDGSKSKEKAAAYALDTAA